MKQVIIRGYYGRDNLGDELMKDLFIRKIRDKNVKLYIMNSSPNSLKKEYGIDTPNELVTGQIPNLYNFIKRFIMILKSDLYVYGGGTILTDKHSYFHLIENCIYFVSRNIIRKKNLLVSVGATEFKTNTGKFFCKVLIQNSKYSYIRDCDSYNLLQKMTKNSKRLVQVADMVLLTKDLLNYNVNESEHEKIQKKIIGVCVMPYYFATYHDEEKDLDLKMKLIYQLERIQINNPNLTFHLIPIQYGANDNTDYAFSEDIYNELKEIINIKIINEKNLNGKLDALSKCEFVLSMRLHALMVAKLLDKKVFAINHNEKIKYFMNRYDSKENSVTIDELDDLYLKFQLMIDSPYINKNQNLIEDFELAKLNLNIFDEFI